MSAADEASAARQDDAIAAPAGADSTPDTVDGVAAFARL
ncbi:MAG TPA: segregation/condensation protein A, partial [Burkholderia sp.]|nr:segregation/condensation protein A [Burkholderia sp.]